MDNPLTYRHGVAYTVVADIEDIYKRADDALGESREDIENIVRYMIRQSPMTAKDLECALREARRRFKIVPKRSQLIHVLWNIDHALSETVVVESMKRLLVKKAAKSQSGVIVITVLTSPYPKVGNKTQRFSCEWNCYYCPNERGQPRSYLHDEPAVMRANENGFDAVLQFTDRATAMAMNGHPIDKIELLVLGGTWASYPHEYQEEFVRDLFYAANTFGQRANRRTDRWNLEEEQCANETATCVLVHKTS